MVSVACPNCNILLVEADSGGATNGEPSALELAVQKAAEMGADVISNSWGGSESPEDLANNTYLKHPGIPVVVASGDSGYKTTFPASSPDVIPVGGTYLFEDKSNPRGWSEEAVSFGGSGCSAYQPKPAWQSDSDCMNRTVADVSAVAVGVFSFSTERRSSRPSWFPTGGTSVSAPLVAGIVARQSKAFKDGGAKSFYEAGDHHELYDVVKGSNGSCNASYLCEADGGYDGPTGNGTPGTPLAGPAAASAPVTILQPEEATLNGAVNPYGVATTYRFEYGTTTAYGSFAPAAPASVGSGFGMTSVSQTITGLKPKQVYHFRVAATSSEGTKYSKDRSFTTPAEIQPIVTTGSASNLQPTGATLNGTIDPHGANTSYQFEYGPTTSYGFSVPVPAKEIGTKSGAVSQTISGLISGRTYHFRLKATNSVGAVVYGSDKALTTLPGPPIATTDPATELDEGTATLQGPSPRGPKTRPSGSNTLARAPSRWMATPVPRR